MPRVFNSTFENALRIILLLDAFGTPQNTDMLYATDFIVVYIAIGIDLDGKKDALGMWAVKMRAPNSGQRYSIA